MVPGLYNHFVVDEDREDLLSLIPESSKRIVGEQVRTAAAVPNDNYLRGSNNTGTQNLHGALLCADEARGLDVGLEKFATLSDWSFVKKKKNWQAPRVRFVRSLTVSSGMCGVGVWSTSMA